MPRIIFPPADDPLPDGGLSQEHSIAALLGSSKRRKREVPIRRSLVQRVVQGDSGDAKAPSPLSALVRARRERALDLYLLMASVTTAAPYDVTERSELWARCLGHHAPGASASVMVSRLWLQLEQLGLIKRSQNGKFTKITKLMEDGTSTSYRPPIGMADGPLEDIYFRLPFQYWVDGLHEKLTLSGKALLLICMSRRDPQFYIPEVFADWYGLSPKTIRKGREELLTAGVLTTIGYGIYIDTSLPTLTTTADKYAFQAPYNLNVSKRATAADCSAGDETKTEKDGQAASTSAPDEPLLPTVEFLVRKGEAG
ncbi:hypothetical protein [Streptomyces flaveus]|uniref:Uncharacterized protein n=1 Tax=Streptomyces flaveus TaxID=66370 RepID=A0A917R5A9_9ACTN|nr:hypothetical protein [Streptomyces flaveus]GGK90249.1 hypothetical protein GCM10010094_59130 [Streptomyces flaveus]